MSQTTRSKVIQLYKNLLYMGREYPRGYDYFRDKLKTAFLEHKNESDPKELKILLARGRYLCKELEAFYMLKKYRTLKKRYYDEPK